MARNTSESWRELRVGDRVRIVQLPSYANLPGRTFHSETRELYERLIARRRSLRIYEVDADGLPWINCRFKLDDGTWEHHYLALNDDSWERVKPRNG
jgi:hypothetical protein